MEMKDVLISITGLQPNNFGRQGPVELITTGQYGFENGVGRLTYLESELTGLAGTRTSFSVDSGGVVLSREGSVTSSVTFEEGRKDFFLYDTPYGSSTMAISTKRVNTRLDESCGDMEIDYSVDLDNAYLGRSIFRISFRENSGRVQ